MRFSEKLKLKKHKNIARGTTDPEIDSVTLYEHGTTCINCKFGHQTAPIALVANMAPRWRHLQ